MRLNIWLLLSIGLGLWVIYFWLNWYIQYSPIEYGLDSEIYSQLDNDTEKLLLFIIIFSIWSTFVLCATSLILCLKTKYKTKKTDFALFVILVLICISSINNPYELFTNT